ncbi:hypothetical protein ABIB90_006679 [Bradyrhizobium sp. JR4.1]|uniref:hypothetical protein n=1 Tax=Bradyrhizobium TaxID=374 RepID=UPI001FDA5516|nr:MULTISPECIES: hypothetical protein [Bradyrhizobium]
MIQADGDAKHRTLQMSASDRGALIGAPPDGRDPRSLSGTTEMGMLPFARQTLFPRDGSMDAKSAARFKWHIERVIEELSLALTLAKEASPADEFLSLRMSVGDIISQIDAVLQDNIYKDHPGLDGMKD